MDIKGYKQDICNQIDRTPEEELDHLLKSSKNINLFLDDSREPPQGFLVARSYQDCIMALKTNSVRVLSLDHDLGEKKTGYDVVKWMVNEGIDNPQIYPREIYLHTANPVGRENMYQLLMRFKPRSVKVHYCPMPLEYDPHKKKHV